MKKFTLFLTMLVAMVSTAMAQLQENAVYRIVNKETSRALAATTNAIAATVNKTDNSQLWVLEQGSADGTFALRNLGTGTYLDYKTNNNANWGMSQTAKNFYIGVQTSVTDNDYYYISYEAIPDKAVDHRTCAHDPGASQKENIVRWDNSAGASQWSFIFVADDENGPHYQLIEEVEQTWTANPVAPWSEEAATDVPAGVTAVQSGGTVHMAETNVIVNNKGQIEVTFKYSGGNCRLDILGVDLVDTYNNVVSYDYHFGFTGNEHSKNVYNVNVQNPGKYTMRYFVNWNDNRLSDTNGNISVAFYNTNIIIEEAESLLDNPFVTAEHKTALQEAINSSNVHDLSVAIEAAKADLYLTSINDFNNNTLYTFTTSRGSIVYVPGNNNVASTAHSAAANIEVTDDNTQCQWAVYKSKNDKYYMYNVAAGKFMGYNDQNNGTIPFVEIPTTKNLTFVETGNNAYPIMFRTNNNGAANHSAEGTHTPGLINWNGGANNTSDAGNIHQVKRVAIIDDATLASITQLVSEYEDFPYELTVGAAGYATLYLAAAADIPEDENLKVYRVASLTGDYALLDEIEGVIPANTGVIVEAPAGVYTFNKSTATPDAVENKLEGTTVDAYIDAVAGTTYYVLSKQGDDVGFYPADIEATGGKFFNNENRAYLPITGAAAQSAGFRFEFGTTGIENVENAAEEAVYYDLSGRRVANPVKGIYIVNGKKVLVK